LARDIRSVVVLLLRDSLNGAICAEVDRMTTLMLTYREKTALLVGVAHEARRRGLKPDDPDVSEMLRLATSWVRDGSAPLHTAAKWAALLTTPGRSRMAS
jgi:hypothetical protein